MKLTAVFEKSQVAARALNMTSDAAINQVLADLADLTEARAASILAANKEDLARMDIANPKYARLKLSEPRIADIASDIRNVSNLPSQLGRILSQTTRPNGMELTKIAVPFGVIGIIYEARPNVGFDVFSLCLKSGNACILKGGSDAACSNEAIVKVIHEALRKNAMDENIVTLLSNGHDATAALLNAVGFIDLIIPRGGKQLINFVRDNAKIPVIETGAGICHTYFDEFGDLAKA